MPNPRRCGTCIHASTLVDTLRERQTEPDSDNLRCQRYPASTPPTNDDKVKDDWCGEWQRAFRRPLKVISRDMRPE